jgi:MFS family permease
MATSQAAEFGGTRAVPVFNRWLIPVAAVLVHICIGSVYAWSTFNRPIKAIFHTSPWWFSPPYTTFTSALVLLGLSAAFGGPRVERRGRRAAATAAAFFFGSGLVIGGVGLAIRQAVLVWIGMGIIGGIGAGLGYIAPVSTLVKWFPDRRGMATGMAIMGFGGGAFLAGYLNVYFMGLFGVARTVMVLGVTYFIIMMIGARIIRRPPPDWKPAGWTPPVRANKMITGRSVSRNHALCRVQFYLLWGILFINVTAGIGILAQASPMMQDMFGKAALQAGAIVSIVSLFNARGAFFLGFAIRSHRPPQYVSHVLHRAGGALPADSELRREGRVGAFPDCDLYGFHHVWEVLPRFPLSSRTSSAKITWAPFTARC